jgi:hypothetical protein
MRSSLFLMRLPAKAPTFSPAGNRQSTPQNDDAREAVTENKHGDTLAAISSHPPQSRARAAKNVDNCFPRHWRSYIQLRTSSPIYAHLNLVHARCNRDGLAVFSAEFSHSLIVYKYGMLSLPVLNTATANQANGGLPPGFRCLIIRTEHQIHPRPTPRRTQCQPHTAGAHR